jgi:selenophosphate synthetase-related protein
MTARVALMELLSIGANPIAIIGTFSVEPEPTGNQVIEGIEEELRSSQLRDLKLLCSSEKNMKVDQTGIGITVVGVVSSSAVKIAQCEEGDEVIAVGEPYVGREVIHAEKHRMLPNTLDVMKLRRNRFVHELIPVGSKGILYEARLMAEDSRLFFEPLSSQQVDLKKSAGPATVLVSAIRKGSFAQVKKALGAKPIGKIGTLRQR